MKKKILFADDDGMLLKALVRLYGDLGFEAYGVDSPLKAEESFREIKPDLAVFDYRMRGGGESDTSGLDLALKLAGEIPIIMFSGDDQPDGVILPENMFWFSKWGKTQELHEKIKKLLKIE